MIRKILAAVLVAAALLAGIGAIPGFLDNVLGALRGDRDKANIILSHPEMRATSCGEVLMHEARP